MIHMTSSLLIKNVNIIPMPGFRMLRGYDVVIQGTRIKRIFLSRKLNHCQIPAQFQV